MLPDEEDGPDDPIPGEPSDLEPEEYDPEAELYDPESDSITIPQVEIPKVETPESEVPKEIKIAFWSVVLVVNAAVLAVSLGVMFAVFTGNLRRAVALVVGGLVLFGMAYRRYRRFVGEDEASGGDVAGEDGDSEGAGISDESGDIEDDGRAIEGESASTGLETEAETEAETETEAEAEAETDSYPGTEATDPNGTGANQ